MRIGIDGRALSANKTGIGQYTKSLLSALLECAPEDEFIIFSNKEIDFKQTDNCRTIECGKMKSNFWFQTVFPYLLEKHKVDILHSPMFILPLVLRIPSIITVHDMVHEIYRETTKWKNYITLKALLPNSIIRAKFIIADSENTKKDIIKYLHVDPVKIRVIYLGCDKKFNQAKDSNLINKIKKKYQLPEKYILTVGTLEPRKNLERLFEAYEGLYIRYPEMEQKLIVVGAKGWKFGNVFSAVERLHLGEKVIFTDYISDEDLPFFYFGADLFVFPSLYEGFGLPPLEAMACGIPVISSSAASLPEVVGKAAVLFDPYDVEGLSYAMEDILFNDSLKKELIRRGLEQAQKFSWEKGAHETLSLYREVFHCVNLKEVNK